MISVPDLIRQQFAEAGVRGWLHARRVDSSFDENSAVVDSNDSTVDVDSRRPVAMSSVYKLPLLVSLCRMVDDGGLDPGELVTVRPEDRTPGPTGISLMLDPVTMSWRDLTILMMTVSDNAAADTILRRVGVDRVASTLRRFGLTDTRITGGTADAYRILHQDTATTSLAEALAVLADTDHPAQPRAYDPVRSSSASAKDMTTLLSAIWRNTAASPAQCAFIRAVMSRQVNAARLRSGFAFDGVQVSGKTGTLGALRHEVGVVQYDDEPPYAVAVFTHAARGNLQQPRVDHAIGTTARTAVEHLRSSRAAGPPT